MHIYAWKTQSKKKTVNYIIKCQQSNKVTAETQHPEYSLRFTDTVNRHNSLWMDPYVHKGGGGGE